MEKITLEKLLYRKYLITTSVSVFCIGLFLIFFYFIVNKNMINKSKDLILNNLNIFINLITTNQEKIETDKFLEYLSLKNFPYEGKIVIMEESGKINFINEDLKTLFNIKENENVLKNNTYKISSYFKEILEGKKVEKIILNNQNYLLFPKKIENSKFYLLIVIDEINILKETNTLVEYCKKLEYLLISGVVFFLFTFIFLSLFHCKKFYFSNKCTIIKNR